MEQARQEARRISDEAQRKAKTILEDARSEADRLLAGARQRMGNESRTRPNDPSAQLAREYQALLVQHLSKVTDFIGDEGSAILSPGSTLTADTEDPEDETTQLTDN